MSKQAERSLCRKAIEWFDSLGPHRPMESMMRRRFLLLALALTLGIASESQACGLLRGLFGGYRPCQGSGYGASKYGCGYGTTRTQCQWPEAPVVATSPGLPTIIPVQQPACPECERIKLPRKIGE
jgi:hypothetical protein